MPLNEKEEALLAKSEEALELLYDYFQYSSNCKPCDYTSELMNKMTEAVKASIRFNNSLVKALEDKVVVLSPQALSMLNSFYSFYEQMPKNASEVENIGGAALMDVYTGIIQNITPIALLISSSMDVSTKATSLYASAKFSSALILVFISSIIAMVESEPIDESC